MGVRECGVCQIYLPIVACGSQQARGRIFISNIKEGKWKPEYCSKNKQFLYWKKDR